MTTQILDNLDLKTKWRVSIFFAAGQKAVKNRLLSIQICVGGECLANGCSLLFVQQQQNIDGFPQYMLVIVIVIVCQPSIFLICIKAHGNHLTDVIFKK